MIVCRVVPHGGPFYEKTVELRREVLRLPLGLDFTPEELAAENSDIHLAACVGETVIGCLVLTSLADGEVKMRQVAVSLAHRGRGVGRELVRTSEWIARTQSFRTMVLNARDTAIPFYLHLGYELVGEPFVEVGIPHRKMRKALRSS